MKTNYKQSWVYSAPFCEEIIAQTSCVLCGSDEFTSEEFTDPVDYEF